MHLAKTTRGSRDARTLCARRDYKLASREFEIFNWTQNILKIAKTHQSSLIQLNKKLKFTLFSNKTTRNLIAWTLKENTNHRRKVAKFRTSNHKLIIEYGRYCTPKIDSISHKYPNFHPLSANDMILFLFNNVDSFVCKKLGHFIFLAFETRQSRALNIATI